MSSHKPLFFSSEEEAYLVAQLNNSDDRIAVKALQWLCKKLTDGFVLAEMTAVKSTVRLCLYRPSATCRRWAVNALTDLGAKDCVDVVLGMVKDADEDPDLLASIVAYVFASNTDKVANEKINSSGLEIDGTLLIAASQFSIKQKKRLVETRIPLENGSEAEFRAAVVLTGLGKAPEHLFHERHTNFTALSQLNLHDAPSVSKYSIWAQARLKLGFSSLQVPTSKYESSEPQVRKWMARLLVTDEYHLRRELDFFDTCVGDDDENVRLEIALELRDNYVPEISKIVRNWMMRETDSEIRNTLQDHMASYAYMDGHYAALVVELYKRAAKKSPVRMRLEAASAQTEIYRELKKISWEQEGLDLYSNDNDQESRLIGRPTVSITNNNFSNSTIGAFANNGNIDADVIKVVQGMGSSDTRQVMEKVLALLVQLDSKKTTKQGEALVAEIAKKPDDKPAWRRLLEFIKGVRDGIDATSDLYVQAGEILGEIGSLPDLSGFS